MRRSPNARRLHAGAAPEAEVVQHVGELVRVVGGLCEVLVQQLSLVVRIGGHCDGVPGLDENCLEIVCHPVALGAGVLDSEKNVPGRENGSFSDGVDSQWKMTFRVLNEQLYMSYHHQHSSTYQHGSPGRVPTPPC